jgi:hypothetical protein
MHNKSVRKPDLAAAQRGLIVQRVLVDRWTLAEAGAPFGIDERHVASLVAAYQRHGMAALRGAVEGGLPRWFETCLGWIGAWPRGGGTGTDPVTRRSSFAPDEPIRRGRWN